MSSPQVNASGSIMVVVDLIEFNPVGLAEAMVHGK